MPAMETIASVVIDVIGDTTAEPDEKFGVYIDDVGPVPTEGNFIWVDRLGIGTIDDDD
jgi:hypothetical protein